jgi:hypothetical protein
MNEKRPTWVTCVLTGYHLDKHTWCGRIPDAFEFTFVDSSHAILNNKNEGRLRMCPECREEIINIINL